MKTSQLQFVFLYILTISLPACTSKGNEIIETGSNSFSSKEAFPALTFTSPVDMQHADDGSNRLFVVEQAGVIKVFENSSSVSSSAVFLDIKNKVTAGGERGLLGLAFHPDYESNGYFYVNYTAGNPLKTIIARFKANQPSGNQADPSSETVLLTFDQPYSNHNGGSLQFGKDGFLYIATGDGGSGGDPQNNAQNRRSLLGKILRIDVNGIEKGTYSIPADNPFVKNSEQFREEIFAYGLRNPWKISFDPETDYLYAADVGQNEREEINLITKGGNYGWRIKEGVDCYNPSSNCNAAGLIEPIHDYSQENGDRSITGGYIYTGDSLPGLKGKYIYGDFVSGRIWALEMDGDKKKNNTLLLENKGTISSFGRDAGGEVYYLNYGEGKVMKFAGSLN
jgi:glucose/arabinose dehydrogenase